MGYRWQQLKDERERQLRAIRAREMTSLPIDLFSPTPDRYSSVYTCQIRNSAAEGLVAGLSGLLTMLPGKRVGFWSQKTVGYLCPEDAEDLLKHFPAAIENDVLCIGRVADAPNQFNTFKLETLPFPPQPTGKDTP